MKKVIDYKHRSGPGYEHLHEDMTWGHLVSIVLITVIFAQVLADFIS